jgi:hypothetical protein
MTLTTPSINKSCESMKKDIIRRCYFRPYLPGKGPTFSLVVWDTGRRNPPNALGSRCYLGYQLYIKANGKRRLLFEGDDFSPSPLCAIDSDEAVCMLMGYLTLRPGDTDREYFDNYTPEQLHYCEQWAESLNGEVSARYEDENGNPKKSRR